jgi:hypothetical protein
VAYDRDWRFEELWVAAVAVIGPVVVDREAAVFAAARTTLVVAEDLRIMAASNPRCEAIFRHVWTKGESWEWKAKSDRHERERKAGLNDAVIVCRLAISN